MHWRPRFLFLGHIIEFICLCPQKKKKKKKKNAADGASNGSWRSLSENYFFLAAPVRTFCLSLLLSVDAVAAVLAARSMQRVRSLNSSKRTGDGKDDDQLQCMSVAALVCSWRVSPKARAGRLSAEKN